MNIAKLLTKWEDCWNFWHITEKEWRYSPAVWEEGSRPWTKSHSGLQDTLEQPAGHAQQAQELDIEEFRFRKISITSNCRTHWAKTTSLLSVTLFQHLNQWRRSSKRCAIVMLISSRPKLHWSSACCSYRNSPQNSENLWPAFCFKEWTRGALTIAVFCSICILVVGLRDRVRRRVILTTCSVFPQKQNQRVCRRFLMWLERHNYTNSTQSAASGK